MSRDKLQLLSPLFLKYQNEYEKNPRSRVFAPLAETYRKLGMTDKAMEILSQGIRFHPTYVMGYLGLAFCYFDLKQFNLAYSTLRPLVESNRDNIRLQKLFADICLELNHKEEALETFKYLLFINPRDREVAAQVTMLENLIESQYRPVHKPIFIPENELIDKEETIQKKETELFNLDNLDVVPQADKQDFDDWLALDLSKDSKKISTDEEKFDLWNLKKVSGTLEEKKPLFKNASDERSFEVKNEPKSAEKNIPPTSTSFAPTLDLDTNEDSPAVVTEAPLVTHTLVDLYCGQGHIEKALEVLEKILALNPQDKRTINKIAEIKALMGVENEFEDKTEETSGNLDIDLEQFTAKEHTLHAKTLVPLEENTVTEEEGRQHLMSLIDETLGPDHAIEEGQVDVKKSDELGQTRIVEEKLTRFLQKIHKRALEIQSRV